MSNDKLPDWIQPLVEKRAEEVTNEACENDAMFYISHTRLFEKVLRQAPIVVKEVLILEEMYSARYDLVGEAYKKGFIDGYRNNRQE